MLCLTNRAHSFIFYRKIVILQGIYGNNRKEMMVYRGDWCYNPIFDSINARKLSNSKDSSHFQRIKSVAIYYYFFWYPG